MRTVSDSVKKATLLRVKRNVDQAGMTVGAAVKQEKIGMATYTSWVKKFGEQYRTVNGTRHKKNREKTPSDDKASPDRRQPTTVEGGWQPPRKNDHDWEAAVRLRKTLELELEATKLELEQARGRIRDLETLLCDLITGKMQMPSDEELVRSIVGTTLGLWRESR